MGTSVFVGGDDSNFGDLKLCCIFFFIGPKALEGLVGKGKTLMVEEEERRKEEEEANQCKLNVDPNFGGSCHLPYYISNLFV